MRGLINNGVNMEASTSRSETSFDNNIKRNSVIRNAKTITGEVT